MQKNLKKYGWLFLLPTAVAFLFAFAAPFVLGVGLSFTRFRTVTDAAWVGLQNYVQAFTADSGFLHALWFTALFSGVSIITVNVLAFCTGAASYPRAAGHQFLSRRVLYA